MKKNIVSWFNVNDIMHLKAYNHLEKTGLWPEDFLPEDIQFSTSWQMILSMRLASEYIKLMLSDD